MGRRHYEIDSIIINGKVFFEVIIDSHYEEKHSTNISDNLILNLISRLHNRYEMPVDFKDEFNYFVTVVDFNEKFYRLVWLLEDNTSYIGVINAFRVKKGE